MTDRKALIAEARRAETDWTIGPGEMRELVRRLAAALEEATPPEGWRVTEYTRGDGARVWLDDEAEKPDWGVIAPKQTALSTAWGHDTARAAMEALDTQKAPPLPTTEE